MVVSPEHPYLDKYKDEIKNWDEIESYREQASRKSDFERAELAKDKTGVEQRLTDLRQLIRLMARKFQSGYQIMYL